MLTLPLPLIEKEKQMAQESVDLSPNVMNALLTETAANMQASNRNTRGVFDAVMGALAGTVQTNVAEVGVLEGRSVSGVMATPIAGPTKSL